MNIQFIRIWTKLSYSPSEKIQISDIQFWTPEKNQISDIRKNQIKLSCSIVAIFHHMMELSCSFLMEWKSLVVLVVKDFSLNSSNISLIFTNHQSPPIVRIKSMFHLGYWDSLAYPRIKLINDNMSLLKTNPLSHGVRIKSL